MAGICGAGSAGSSPDETPQDAEIDSEARMKSFPDDRSATVSTLSLSDRYVFLAIYALAAVVIVAPITVIDIPLLADFPNHVARMHIIGNVDNDRLLAERYAVQFDLVPNLAMDLIVPWLAKLVPLDVAGRLFLGLTLLSTLAGVAVLHRVLFNFWSLYPLAAALFLYHGSLMAGMVNFSLGIGLVPAALALWIRMRYAAAITRLLVGSAVALILFFCHLVALGAYGVLLVGYELVRARDKWSRRDGPRQAASDFAIAGATGLIPVFLFFRMVLAQDSGVDGALPWTAWSWGNLAWKLKALIAPLANYNLSLDLASFALLTGLAIWGWRSGRLELERRMATALGLLALAFVLAPKAIGSGGVFDQRFVVLFALMLVASTRFRATGQGTRLVLPAVLIVLVLVRLGTIAATWVDHRGDLAEIRQAIDRVEPGGRILVVRPDETAGVRLAPPRHMVFHHAPQMASWPALAVIDKSAFVSTLYALPGQQPLILNQPFRHLGGAGAAAIPTLADLEAARHEYDTSARLPSQIRRWWLDFDYVLLIYGYGPGADGFRRDLPLATLLDGDQLDLFQILRK